MFDVLYANGKFYTQNPDQPVVTAVGVHDGRIISVNDELESHLFDRVIDLAGSAVVPGFNDAHCHMTHVGEATMQVDLRPEKVATLDELLQTVGQAAKEAAEGEWIIGAGYDQNFLNGVHPTAEELDTVSDGHPVFLWHVSRHMAVANTAAFEIAGFPQRRNFTVPEGGAVPCDEQGRALGLLEETARALVQDHIPAKDAEDVARLVDAGSRELLKLGVTSITEPGLGAPDHIGMSRFDVAGYQLAKDRGQLGVRSTVMPYLTTLHPLDESSTIAGHQPFTLDLGLRTGMGDDFLSIGPTKVLSDGSLLGRSAFMCCDYDLEEGNRGYLQFPEQTLRERLIGAHVAGWQLAMHAIGDAALDVIMDIVEEAQQLLPRPDARHRIEHAALASDEQIARMKRLGLVAVPQGRFIYDLGDGVRRAVGDARQPLAYRVRGFLDAGIQIPASTDAPVVSADPILNIASLVNRTTSTGMVFTDSERLTVAEAVYAYTVGSAYAVHQEHIKGQLQRGYLADFVVLSQDLYEIEPEQIAETRIQATVVGGELVYGQL